MTVHQPALEALGDHDYLVRFQQDEDTVVVRVHARPCRGSANRRRRAARRRGDRGLPGRARKRRRPARAGRPRYGRRRLRRLCRGPSAPADYRQRVTENRDSPHGQGLTDRALGRQHLAAAHDAHSGRSAHTVYGGHQHTLRQTPDRPDRRHQPRRSRQSRRGHDPGIARARSADQSRHQLGWPPRRSPHHPLHPPRPARRRRLRRCCSPSPNLFSGKAHPAMTTICLERCGQQSQARFASGRHRGRIPSTTTKIPATKPLRRTCGFADRVGGLVVRLVDRFGVGSGSWSR